jgi:hypothetical protein
MAILSFCVIKQYYCGNYHTMAVNYNGKSFYNGFTVVNLDATIIYHGNAVIYNGNLTLENVVTVINYRSNFMTLAPGIKRRKFEIL